MPGTPTEQGPRNSPETAQPLGAVVGMLKGWVERCGWVWVSAQIIELRRRANYSMQFLTLRDTSLEVSAQATATNAVLDAAGPLTEGTTVLACLRPRVWNKTARLSFECSVIRIAGEGRLLAELEQRKRALQAEGLFDPARKRPLPFVPSRIGLITGAGSAAERDVLTNTLRRWPAARFEVRHALMQGPRSAAEVAAALGGFRFGSGFGATLSRLLRSGIGVHHAGMLPRYRRLVERLAREGLLAVICGTDTLGVGINVPIRTVVLTSLVKFDGARERHLSAREFHQIAGRAGRAGFDTRGYVVVQAPEHVIDNARALARAGDDERKRRKIVRKKAPEGRVNWTDRTFERLRDAAPETLTSQFRVTTTMVLNLMERPGDPVAAMAELLSRVQATAAERRRHVRRAIEIYLSLRTAGVVEHVSSARARADGRPRLRLAVDLPDDFALNQPLAPFALAAMDLLGVDSPEHTLDVISVVEATLDDPRPLLYAQQRAARGEAIAAMKAEGMDYEERMAALEEITWPRPLAELLDPALEMYRQSNPWVAEYELSPKSVVRDMVENAMTFSDLISRYELGRSEGVVLRYLTDAYRALRQVVPEEHRTPEVEEVVDWLGGLVRAVDSSLLDEWEALGRAQAGHADEAAGILATDRPEADGTAGVERAFGADADGRVPLTRNLHAFRVAVRREMFRRIELMARDDVEGLGRLDAPSGWGEDRWDGALARYWDEYDWIGTDTAARAVSLAPLDESPDAVALAAAGVSERLIEALEASGRKVWLATQVVEDPDGDHDWRLTALVDLAECDAAERAVVHLLNVGPRS